MFFDVIVIVVIFTFLFMSSSLFLSFSLQQSPIGVQKNTTTNCTNTKLPRRQRREIRPICFLEKLGLNGIFRCSSRRPIDRSEQGLNSPSPSVSTCSYAPPCGRVGREMALSVESQALRNHPHPLTILHNNRHFGRFLLGRFLLGGGSASMTCNCGAARARCALDSTRIWRCSEHSEYILVDKYSRINYSRAK